MSNINYSSPRLLVYQHEEPNTLAEYLQLYGFTVQAADKHNIEQKIKEANYDLCILDHYGVVSPDLRLLKKLRAIDSRVPVIMVSHISSPGHILQAFDEGADDYIFKPFNLDILAGRIKVILKRCGIKTRIIAPNYEIGNYSFNTRFNIVSYKGSETKLTKKEGKMLALLCAYKNEVLPKKILLQQLWNGDDYFNKRSLDVYICRLRTLFKEEPSIQIETRRSLGYTLVINE